MTNGDNEDTNNPHESRKAEPLVGIAGAVVIVAALVFLTYQAVAVRDGGPELTASVTQVEHTGEHYVVHYRVTNDGGTTAGAVQIVGELTGNSKSVQKLTATVAYVPVDSSRTGALIFTSNPDLGRLSVWAAGYKNP